MKISHIAILSIGSVLAFMLSTIIIISQGADADGSLPIDCAYYTGDARYEV